MRLLFSFVLMTFLLVSCKTTAQSSKKGKGYYEDLSEVRPTYKVIEDTSEVEVVATETLPSMEVKQQIDSVITKIAKYNKVNPPNIKGFRVQIYNGSSQSKANGSLAKARSILGKNVYGEAKWKSPVFRTRVGCFVDRLNAYKVYLQLQDEFPHALVVPDNHLSADCVH